jgi:hypothetical protein
MRRLLPGGFRPHPERALTAEAFRGFDSRRLHFSAQTESLQLSAREERFRPVVAAPANARTSHGGLEIGLLHHAFLGGQRVL